MTTLFDDAARAEILGRIINVTADSKARWGKFNAERMLVHICESMKMPVGELTPKPRKLPLRYFPIKQLVIYILPFPKGAPTAPELLPGDVRTIDHNKSELVRLLEKFAARRDSDVWPDHPAFGKMNRNLWGTLAYRHLDHHLRQFGA